MKTWSLNIKQLEHEFRYSRGHEVGSAGAPFGQFCTTASIAPDGLLTIIEHDDLNSTVLQRRTLSPMEFDSVIALITNWLREGSSEGSQWEEEYGISYWNDGAYWTAVEAIRAPGLKQLAVWLQQNISLEDRP